MVKVSFTDALIGVLAPSAALFGIWLVINWIAQRSARHDDLEPYVDPDAPKSDQ